MSATCTKCGATFKRACTCETYQPVIHTDKSLIAAQAARITELEDQLSNSKGDIISLRGSRNAALSREKEVNTDWSTAARKWANEKNQLSDHIADLEKQRTGLMDDLEQKMVRVDLYEERITELEARLEWQPIETAPKDGTIIDLYENGRIADCTVCASTGKWVATDIYDKFGSELHIKNPTHWKSLPDKPK